eukprot:5173140-Amphidinium_carterae.1
MATKFNAPPAPVSQPETSFVESELLRVLCSLFARTRSSIARLGIKSLAKYAVTPRSSSSSSNVCFRKLKQIPSRETICSADDLMSPLPIDTCGSSLNWLNSVARKHSACVVVTAQTL